MVTPPSPSAHIGQTRDPVEVDHDLGLGKAEVHERDEALPACQKLGPVAILTEQGQRVLLGARGHVLEAWRFHDVLRV